jgi:hypothetical protein
MSDSETQVTHDDVNTAFEGSRFLTETDDRLLQYLGVLCNAKIQSDHMRLLANNRCITINTLLTKRFMGRVDKSTTSYTRIVIVLAVVSVIASFVSIFHHG